MLTTLSLDPKTKHFAQLLARERGITFAQLVESILRTHLEGASLTRNGEPLPLALLMQQTFAPHPADRFALTASHFPSLLSERHKAMWRAVCETPQFWTGQMGCEVTAETFSFHRWRELFPIFDDMTRSELESMNSELKEQSHRVAVSFPAEMNARKESSHE